MKKVLLPKFQLITAGVLTGALLYTQKDFLYKKYYRNFYKSPIEDILSKEEQIFSTNEAFLRENLVIYDLVKKKKNEAEFMYVPSINSQGHFMICHGGFTASMVEYSSRYLLTENERSNFVLSEFFIKYIKPIFVYKEYLIILLENKDDQSEKSFKVEIWDKSKKQIYCIGDVKFRNN